MRMGILEYLFMRDTLRNLRCPRCDKSVIKVIENEVFEHGPVGYTVMLQCESCGHKTKPHYGWTLEDGVVQCAGEWKLEKHRRKRVSNAK